MAYFTFLVAVEATVEGPDAGEAADDIEHAIREMGVLKDTLGNVIGVLHEPDAYLRWWSARPVEVVMVERARASERRRRRKQ